MGNSGVGAPLEGKETSQSRWCVVVLGLGFTSVSAFYIWFATEGHPLAHGIIGALPIALSLCLVAMGVWLGNDVKECPSRDVALIGLAGAIIAGLLNLWTLGVAMLVGESIPHAPGILLTNMTLGALVGTGAGIYRSRSQARSEITDRLVRAMDMTGDGVTLVDPDGTVLYANRAFADLYNYEREHLVGRESRELVTAEDVDRLQNISKTIGSDGRWRGEIRGKRSDGSTFPQEVTLSRMDDGTHVAVVRDITERREREERVTLLQRVLRHNLRNELNIISGHAVHIEQDGDEALAEHASVIRDVVQRLADISDTARDIERVLDRSTAPVQRRLDRLAVEAVSSIRDEYPEVAIHIDVPPVSVVVDEAIDSAIEEVLENAAKYAADPSAESDQIRVTGERVDDMVSLRIADTGPGMPLQEREVLAEGRETPLQHGSGLGLWLVRWLVTRAGGDVAVHDNEPRGTVVELRFRCATSDAE